MEVILLIKITIGLGISVPVLKYCFNKHIRNKIDLLIQKMKEKRNLQKEEKKKARKELDSALYLDE